MTTRETEEAIMQALQAHEIKIQQLGQQMFGASMLLEFIIDHLVAAKRADGEPLINMDLDKFEEYATDRRQEILEEVEKLRKEQLTRMGEARAEVNLDE